MAGAILKLAALVAKEKARSYGLFPFNRPARAASRDQTSLFENLGYFLLSTASG
jgi:hypothetical protein